MAGKSPPACREIRLLRDGCGATVERWAEELGVQPRAVEAWERGERVPPDPPLRSDAGVRPKDIEDKKTSLEDRLKSGFMAAYRQRVASATGEPVSNN